MLLIGLHQGLARAHDGVGGAALTAADLSLAAASHIHVISKRMPRLPPVLWMCTALAIVLLLANSAHRPAALSQRPSHRHALPPALPPQPPSLPPPSSQPPPPIAEAREATLPAAPVDVVVAADAPLWPGVAGLIRSARASSASPSALRFNLITLPSQVAAARRALGCYGLADGRLVLLPLPEHLLAAGHNRFDEF